ncbi:heat- and acid-stable phosphoprotein [Carex littledalei]|uniref:Heat- and acid-stable phosphoprotein n=1 Tax=Carex littledalei TaxID=544730 RepID=A0A833R001_9POAL|nr:heat- and acid-stable phosphoprotein [Carex littledalei]
MGRGKFKGKPTGRRNFSMVEEMAAGTSTRPRTFKKEEAEYNEKEENEETEESEDESEEETKDDSKRKGTEGVIKIENPNLANPKNMKAKEVDLGKTTELSRREREELEKQKAHEQYMRLQKQGKTEQRAKAAKKRERRAAKEQKKTEARK